MRTVFGYTVIALLLPVAVFLFYFTNAEAHKVRSFDEVVDEKIVIKDVHLPQASKMVDKDGNPYLEIHQPYRIIADGKIIPPFLKELFLQSEDKHFYDHSGINAAAVMRAMLVNAKADGIEQGASTITQQLARNVYLSHDRTLVRKVSEVLYAYELEKRLSKDEILNLYLNAIYFNHQVYGVEAAAQFYFQKHVNELTKAQMAFIAAIPNNPSLYDPVRHFDNTKKRQERLIDMMQREEFITAAEAEEIKKEPIKLQVRDRIDKYASYSTYVEDELKRLIAKTEGFDQQLQNAKGEEKTTIEHKLNDRVQEVMSSGIVVHTSLDPAKQRQAENAVNSVMAGSSVQASASVIKNDTRDIVALVGGKDFDRTQFNRSFQGFRQPGSTIKPLLDFGPYIDTTQAGVNSMVSADKYCVRGWCPKNYSGKEYGMVTLKTALSKSYNTAALRLFIKTGNERAYSYLEKFEFERMTEKDRYSDSKALGGFRYGMTTLEIAGAYTSFIDGTFTKPRAIQKVTDRQGNLLYEWKDEPKTIWSKATTYKMRYLLADVIQNGTGKKANPGTAYAGGKTGTTNNTRDLWFAGLTDQYTAGVWVGKDVEGSIRYLEKYAPNQLIWRRIVR
ncbi:transglycosylase domain-containing protein [Pseudobacillus badius]|uniref:transglycosylase domain-containing protein n=1 Tax=Bacillus badius TaxID=1455 RepID=UPI0007B084F4|nr:transglycosylase domain-containing protein [Bacillus badius]KZO00457.1 penicillin-binding protein [Bacillus badius]MED0667770.1 transglycosylase domain-containing protein [Bacillus badius]OCS86855.1 penicillin-binding protein [Bacillus badius]OVE47967.1 penicillin-binding protein [Bacillus badius]TDV99824.1 penicillin-binding protein 1A [Bacillus badius]